MIKKILVIATGASLNDFITPPFLLQNLYLFLYVGSSGILNIWGTEVTLSGGFTSISERPQPAWGKRRQVPQTLMTHHNLPVAMEGHTATRSPVFLAL